MSLKSQYRQLLYVFSSFEIINFPTNLYTCIIFHLHTYYSMCTAKIHLLNLTKSILYRLSLISFQITSFPKNLYTCIIFHLHTYYAMCTAKIHVLNPTKSLLSFLFVLQTSLQIFMHASYFIFTHITVYTMYIYCQNTPIKSFSSICFY